MKMNINQLCISFLFLQIMSPFNHSSQAFFGAGPSSTPQITANVESNTSTSDDEV